MATAPDDRSTSRAPHDRRPSRALGHAVRIAAVAPSMVLYAVAVAHPVAIETDKEDFSGFFLLALGWLVLFRVPAWFANLFLPIGWVAILLPSRVGRVIALGSFGTALAIALTSIGVVWMPISMSEGGYYPTHEFQGFGVGFYLWIGSFVAALAGAIARVVIEKRAGRARERSQDVPRIAVSGEA